MTFNKIYTDKEYLAQGFTKEEVPMIRKHDILFNKYQVGEATEEEAEEMFKLVEILGI
jgi:hypothetical protein